MTETTTSTSTSPPLIWVQDDVLVQGRKERSYIDRYTGILAPPEDLKETVESLIEIGLSQVEKMREVLQLMGEVPSRDERFQDISREMRSYGEILFREDRYLPLHHDRSVSNRKHKPFQGFRISPSGACGGTGRARDGQSPRCGNG